MASFLEAGLSKDVALMHEVGEGMQVEVSSQTIPIKKIKQKNFLIQTDDAVGVDAYSQTKKRRMCNSLLKRDFESQTYNDMLKILLCVATQTLPMANLSFDMFDNSILHESIPTIMPFTAGSIITHSALCQTAISSIKKTIVISKQQLPTTTTTTTSNKKPSMMFFDSVECLDKLRLYETASTFVTITLPPIIHYLPAIERYTKRLVCSKCMEVIKEETQFYSLQCSYFHKCHLKCLEMTCKLCL